TDSHSKCTHQLRRIIMKVHIRVLRGAPTLPARLRRDGWVVEFEADGSLMAYHPEAPTATQTRERLLRLDMLTSANLCIDFSLAEGPSSVEPVPALRERAKHEFGSQGNYSTPLQAVQ